MTEGASANWDSQDHDSNVNVGSIPQPELWTAERTGGDGRTERTVLPVDIEFRQSRLDPNIVIGVGVNDALQIGDPICLQ